LSNVMIFYIPENVFFSNIDGLAHLSNYFLSAGFQLQD
jgi:hypothetical protein